MNRSHTTSESTKTSPRDVARIHSIRAELRERPQSTCAKYPEKPLRHMEFSGQVVAGSKCLYFRYMLFFRGRHHFCSASTEPRFDVNGRPSLEGESSSAQSVNCRCMVSDVTPSTFSATSEHPRDMFDRMCRATIPNTAERENRVGPLSRKNSRNRVSSSTFHRVRVGELGLASRGRKRPAEVVTSEEMEKRLDRPSVSPAVTGERLVLAPLLEERSTRRTSTTTYPLCTVNFRHR